MTTRLRVSFTGSQGAELAGALELPSTQPRAYALFAHCFSCGKDIAAASRISRWLAAKGIAVLRFDFTGLGNSNGDFGNSGFSGNVADLKAAADWLRTEYQAPTLLVGHSLGGTAVIAAAPLVPECQAVVTIGSPAEPAHVMHLLGDVPAELDSQESFAVDLGGRPFAISGKFVDDLKATSVLEQVPKLRRALLVMHAPFDPVVGIDQAGQIFSAAKHPKSFVSLEDADHMLTRLDDAQYVAETIAAWANRYLPKAPAKVDVAGGELLVQEVNQKFLRQVVSDDHAWLADEPKSFGGENLGPDPYEHLLAALGACTSMTIRMYANRKQWPLEDVDVLLRHSREHQTDCEGCDETPAKLEILSRTIHLHGPLDETQRQRLLEIADRCPVHRTLESDLHIQTELAS